MQAGKGSSNLLPSYIPASEEQATKTILKVYHSPSTDGGTEGVQQPSLASQNHAVAGALTLLLSGVHSQFVQQTLHCGPHYIQVHQT